MLDHVDDVIRALCRYRTVLDPRSGSVITTGRRKNHVAADPFRAGFIENVEERALLVRRLRRLAPRERLLLYLWYCEGQPVTAIASRVGVSRVHCYRLARKALFELTRPGPDEVAAS